MQVGNAWYDLVSYFYSLLSLPLSKVQKLQWLTMSDIFLKNVNVCYFFGSSFYLVGSWKGFSVVSMRCLWIYCIYRGDPVATATKADEYPPFIKWVFGVPEVHVFIFSAFVEWSILLIITINPLDKVLNHTCIYTDGGKFNLTSLKPKCIESKCKTYLFYPIYKVNTVLNILVHGF